MKQSTCPLCDQIAQSTNSDSPFVDFFICERCGEYEISEELKHFTSQLSRVERYILSGFSRERFETEQDPPRLMTTNLEELMTKPPVPNVEDINAKLGKLLAAVKRKSDYFGKIVELSRDLDYPLAYAKNDEEFFAFIDQLITMKLFELKGEDNRTKSVMLSAASWGQPSSNTEDEEEPNAEIGFRVS